MTSPKATQKLADKAVDMITTRVKSGVGVDNEASQRPRRTRLKPLAPSTIEARRRRGVTGEGGRPELSNATDTGQMLKALKGTGKSGFFTIDVDTSGRSGSSQTNKRIQEFYSKDRPWLALTGKEGDELAKEVRTKVNKLVKRFL